MIQRWGRDVKRVVGLLTRRPASIQHEADQELDSVFEERVAYFVARGMSPDVARAEAVRRLGGSLDAARGRVRRSAEQRERMMSIREWLAGLGGDVRYSARGLVREPIFTAFIILTLALGIGANAAMFGIVDKLLLRGPAHVREPERVVRLFWTSRQANGAQRTTAGVPLHAYANLIAESRAFAGLAFYSRIRTKLLIGDGPNARLGSWAAATPNLLSVLGTQPALGRFFVLGEQERDLPVVFLSYSTWRNDFGGDSSVVGRTVMISGQRLTVVGVAPPGFTAPDLTHVDFWRPSTMPAEFTARSWASGSMEGPDVVARLRPGVTFEQAALDATTIHQRTYDGPDKDYAKAALSVGPLHYGSDGGESTEVRIAQWLIGMSAVVLLVACANIVNLLLARAARRSRELAVRVALGAGRARLLRLLLANSLLLAVIGGCAGLVVAYGMGSIVRHVLLPDVDWGSSAVDARVLLFSLGATVVTGIFIGLLPAYRAGRVDAGAVLKAGVREGGGRTSLIRASLMFVQPTLAMMLLIGAGLFVRSLDRVRHLDFGIQTDRVLLLAPSWPRAAAHASKEEQARDQQRRQVFATEVLDRVRAAPGIGHAAAVAGVPFETRLAPVVHVPGRDSLPAVADGFSVPEISMVSPDYFATVGTRLLRGRVLTSADRAGSEPVAVISALMAQMLWPGQKALNQCLLIFRDSTCTRVVGVVQDVRLGILRGSPMHYYVPLAQYQNFPFNNGPSLLVQPLSEPTAAIPALRALLRQVDPTITFVEARTLQERIDPEARTWRTGAMMFSLFAGLALIIAAVGTFSVVAYLVEQRRHEIGVRVALGAQTTHVLTLMLRGAVLLTLLGITAGTALALAAGKFVEPLLFQTDARDPVIIGGVGGMLLLVSISASAIPAWRARRVDPMDALRMD